MYTYLLILSLYFQINLYYDHEVANMGERNQYFIFPVIFIKLTQKGGEMSEWIKVGLVLYWNTHCFVVNVY